MAHSQPIACWPDVLLRRVFGSFNCTTAIGITTAASPAPGNAPVYSNRLALERLQIVPTVLGDLMKDKDRARAKRVAEAMLKMIKLDVAGLKRAYEGA